MYILPKSGIMAFIHQNIKVWHNIFMRSKEVGPKSKHPIIMELKNILYIAA
jgi:hypothetical protein